MKTIKFSVLVPVYKTEEYLDSCISSVLAQTYANWELILVDDGSPDRCGEICDAYALRDDRIRAYHTQNKGLLAARQFGRDRASGDYYVFLDSDDSLKPQALTVIEETISRYGSDCVIYGYERVENGRVADMTAKEEFRTYTKSEKRLLYKKVFFDSAYNSLCRKAVRAEVFDGEDYSDFFHIMHGEDLLQSIAVYKKCERITFIPDRLYNYTVNRDSITMSRTPENIQPPFVVREIVHEFLIREDVFTSSDFDEMRDVLLRNLNTLLIQIGCYRITASARLAAFESIRSSEYYKTFLAGHPSPYPYYTLLDKKHDRLLNAALVSRRLLSDLVHLID